MAISAPMIAHLDQSATYLAHLVRVEEPPREIVLNWSTATRANVKGRGGYLRKTGGTSGSDDAGASSTQNWGGDVYVKCTIRNDGEIYFGLADSTSGVTVASIDFAMAVVGAAVKVYESGSLVATSSRAATAGDWLQVRRVGTAITYWHNRTLVHTSALTSSGTVYAKASLKTTSSTINQAVFGWVPTVIRATDHTRRLTFESELYKPLPLLPTQFSRTEGLAPNNAELTHILMAGGVTEADLVGGRWNYARWEFITINYLDLTMGVAQRGKGRLGEFRISTGRFTTELRSLSQPMSQDIGGIVGAICAARKFGDFECGQPLDNYIHDGSINGTPANSLTLVVNIGGAKPNGYFQQGTIYFRNGNDQFYEREIKNNVGNTITLARPFPFLPANSDLVTLTAGKTFVNPDNPSGKNIENFQAQPDVPGASQVYRYPD
jgi:uncharacterized phage protein (TIGR02218 family)